jgi:hypothetical protein
MRFPDTKDSVWVTKKDQSRPSGRTRGKGSGDIGKSEFLRSKETRDRKSRNPEGIGTVHLRDRCRKSGASRHIANREIGVPKVKRNRTPEVPKSRHNRDRPSERTRGRRLVPSAKGPTGGRSSANRKSGYRRSRAQRFCAFRNRDPRNPDEWGTTVSTAAKEDRGVVEASC